MRRDLREAVQKITRSKPIRVTAMLTDTVCWDSKRFLGRCAECDRVEGCKLPQAVQGRKDLALAKLQLKQEQRTRLDTDIKDLKTQLGGML